MSAATNATQVWVNWTSSTACNTTANIDWACDNQATFPVPDAEAQEKAKEILHQHLSEEQRAQLARDRFFVVRGTSGRHYRVKQGRANNIEMLDEQGSAIERLCAHPDIYCPDEDTMLAQKLALEADEESFRRIANKTSLAA